MYPTEKLIVWPKDSNNVSIHSGPLLESVKLPGYDLWMTFIKNVHVIPCRLDVDKFEKALSDVLHVYHYVLGRLHQETGKWMILPTDSGIPLEIEHRSTSDLGIKDSCVIQDDLRELLHAHLREDVPLLRIKLTLSENQTAVGVSWHHTLGDAAVLLRFMHALSQSYQESSPAYPFPTFEKPDFPLPTPKLVEEYLPYMPHLAKLYPKSELGNLYAQLNENIVRINFRIEMDKLDRLRARVLKHVQDASLTVSIQDCLTAYIANVLNRCLDTPVRFITNAASYRDIKEPCIDASVTGNAIYIVSTFMEDDGLHNLTGTAMALRRAILECRQPHFVKNWMSVASHLMLSAANTDRSMFFAAPRGTMSVNSNLSLDWHSIHFGFPGQALFFTSGVNNRYLRVFRSNPPIRTDTKTAQSAFEAVDVCFGVSSHLQSQVMDTLVSELGTAEFPDNIDMTERN
ncbi:hypothetical protein AcW1_005528 [Taiwanofungus camphoratus]|nr:hypothetical protein AcW1_005528 [Antrodia cinnamomea]